MILFIIRKIFLKIIRKYDKYSKRLIFNIRVYSRSKVSIQNISQLALDIPFQFTHELHYPNDYYGIATVIKKYVNYNNKYKIKAAIEHGVYYSDWYWDADVNAQLPAIFCPSEKRYSVLRKITNKEIFTIGPSIAYAQGLHDANTLHNEKARLGKNLLIFPLHSTHWIQVEYNINKFCNYIESISKDFNSITVCLYWKDIINGHQNCYLRRGFECVTAGHMYDPLFLSRMKSIIETSTITMSSGLGTQIGFCILLGKPHFIVIDKSSYDTNNEFQSECRSRLNKYSHDADVNKFYRIFKDIRCDISEEQYNFINLYWGLSEVKSKVEFQEILSKTEELYNNY